MFESREIIKFCRENIHREKWVENEFFDLRLKLRERTVFSSQEKHSDGEEDGEGC